MNSLKYIIFVVSYALYLLFGVLLISELIFDPDIIGIVLMLALTSGAFTIQKRFKAEVFPERRRKFKGYFKKQEDHYSHSIYQTDKGKPIYTRRNLH